MHRLNLEARTSEVVYHNILLINILCSSESNLHVYSNKYLPKAWMSVTFTSIATPLYIANKDVDIVVYVKLPRKRKLKDIQNC
jgi:hypothetical protein